MSASGGFYGGDEEIVLESVRADGFETSTMRAGAAGWRQGILSGRGISAPSFSEASRVGSIAMSDRPAVKTAVGGAAYRQRRRGRAWQCAGCRRAGEGLLRARFPVARPEARAGQFGIARGGPEAFEAFRRASELGHALQAWRLRPTQRLARKGMGVHVGRWWSRQHAECANAVSGDRGHPGFGGGPGFRPGFGQA